MSTNGNGEEIPQEKAYDTVAVFAKKLAESSPPKSVDTIRAAAGAVEHAVAKKRKDARDAMIRDRAYFLWIENGRPEGRHDELWLRAESEL